MQADVDEALRLMRGSKSSLDSSSGERVRHATDPRVTFMHAPQGAGVTTSI